MDEKKEQQNNIVIVRKKNTCTQTHIYTLANDKSKKNQKYHATNEQEKKKNI